ncbi:MAG: tail fiber protein [Bacteroidaceae bacterium]|nr:tail fiber protein [Bacteroidaceae bacterium]MBQ9175318.1 tail fiber protein [Bacteroidaceae bacterium]
MKRKVLLLVVAMVCCISEGLAQNSGLGFNYQAVVRRPDGVLLANSDVMLRISLYPGQSALNATWIETHSVHTDYSGCFGITVGKGVRSGGSIASKFSDINFAAVYYWMKVEVQEGNIFREVSFTALPSTPYSEVANNAMLAAGVIAPFAGPADKVPAGWLLCDGSAVSRSQYESLYNAIGVSWGIGDGSSTFNLPDLRGMFLRGVSGDSGNDADADSRTMLTENGGNIGNNVGSYQGDAIRNIQAGNIMFDNPWGAVEITFTKKIKGIDDKRSFGHFDASKLVPVGSDNRPKNVYVTYIIKY